MMKKDFKKQKNATYVIKDILKKISKLETIAILLVNT